MRLKREVATSVSPIGVAPPVSDDCAPMGRTLAPDRSSAAMSASVAGVTTPAAWPPGKCAASSRNAATTSGSVTTRGSVTGPVGWRARRRKAAIPLY